MVRELVIWIWTAISTWFIKVYNSGTNKLAFRINFPYFLLKQTQTAYELLILYLFDWVSACLSVVDHFVGLAIKGLMPVLFDHHQTQLFTWWISYYFISCFFCQIWCIILKPVLTATVSVYVLMTADLDAWATDVCDLSASLTQHNLESHITHLDICPCVFRGLR